MVKFKPKKLECAECRREYYVWRESCLTCFSSNTIHVKEEFRKAPISLEEKVLRYEEALIQIVNHSDRSYQGEIAKEALEG